MPQPPAFNLAINGFGRIGRNVLRAYLERLGQLNEPPSVNIVAINDLGEPDNLGYLLNYDSTHGRLADRSRIEVTLRYEQQQAYFCLAAPFGEQKIALLNQPDPKQLPWQSYAVDVVLESTGHFRSYEAAYQHIQAGAKQVIIGAAPFDRVDASIVLGVNEAALSRDKPIISGVSCTTQAIVPLLAVLDEAFGIKAAMLTEIHAVTADQTVLDQSHRDWRRGRASGHNIIPTTSSSLNAIARVLPQMAGRINGHSIRVPTLDVAAIDVTLQLATTVSRDQLNEQLQAASRQRFAGIMGYSDEPLVSSDFIHQPQSLVIDSLQTMVISETPADLAFGTLVKVFAWYDNEWGYANRMLDMVAHLAKQPAN